jgi:dTDP-4-amino-4,6-dideoxygalactose transaminase
MYYTLKPILADDLIQYRDKLVHNLTLKGIDAKIPDNRPFHKTEFYGLISKNKDSFSNADRYFSRIISLPSFTYEPIELIHYYGSVIRDEMSQI